MILPRISIQRPVLTTMMSLGLILFGLISLTRLPVRELPDIDPPIVSVSTVYPGASAEVIETEVTERLEEAINNIEGIKTLTSQSREQVSTITVEFNLSRDVDVAAQDVRDRVSRVRGRLPENIREPIVAKQDADANPVLWIAFNSERYSPLELTTLAERQIKNRLQTIEGVSSVMIGGEKRYAMRLWLDSDRMAAHGVTVLDVARALREQNVQLPSGRVENLERELTIFTRGELQTPAEYDALVIRNVGTRLVRLRDVGQARDGAEDMRTVARSNGRPAVFLGVVKQSKANTIEVARAVKAELAAIRLTLPPGIETAIGYDESVFVEKAIHEVWLTLAIAFVLVVLVIFVFLRNLRSTIIPAVAIPVSIVATFAVLYFMGYSVNILTMLAFVLAIGIVVDDAIVVLENIYRHIEEGMRPLPAAFKAMDEIAFAILAITFSLVAVFIPLAFQQTTTGQLFVEFAFALAGSVVVSAFVALSLSPMMAARILKPVDKERHGRLFLAFDRGFQAINRGYGRTLRWALRQRALLLSLGLAILGLTVWLGLHLEREFMPEEDKGRMFALVMTPEGATSEYTDRMLRKVEGFIQGVPETQTYAAIVAPGFGGPGRANFGVAFVTFKEDRTRSYREIVEAPGGLRTKFLGGVEGALAIIQAQKAIGRSFGAPFQLVLQSQDLDALNATATAVGHRMRLMTNVTGAPLFQNVRSSFEVNKPELRLRIDRDRAAALRVSIEDIARTLQILFGGMDLSRIKVEGKEYDVIAQLERSSRLTPQSLDRLYVRNDRGELIQLSNVVTYREGAAPSAIEHYSRLRSATLSATPVGVPLGTAMARVEALLPAELPPGFLYAWSGESRDFIDAGREIWWVFLLALVIVYMVLASQFESLVHPFTVMLAVPLAGLGAFGLLWLLDAGGKVGLLPAIPAMNLNLFSQIGLVLLLGLVTKNSILLVEFANQARARGATAHDAMLEAGQVRLRPILMTAFSTLAGILPIAIGFGAGAESRRPMGIAVVGGLITSTFLTLVIIPVVYTVFSDAMDCLRRKWRHATPLAESLEPVGE
ncbi:MAG: efflux RND transporter permease subunit [Verrucomicrobia bacterium]|nr:efflux RND transporter permease subunit [Verrucomicrobiota bacterium]